MENNNFEKSPNSTYRKVEKEYKNGGSFGKSVLVPFLSGILGTTLVIGTCFGVPSIKNHLLNSNSLTADSSNDSTSTRNIDVVSLTNYSDTAIDVANKVLPSIVGIKVQYTVNSIFNMQSSATAEGSGIIISDDGYILTNNHIVNTASSSNNYSYQVSEASNISVYYNDSTEYPAKLIGTDEQTDLAVIKIDKTDLPKAELGDSDAVKVGEFAMAIGNPLGMKSSVTSGIISAINREVTDTDGKKFTLIQTDAAINSGNSGGALVNSKGQVIGINTLKLSGEGIEGMGFAIPINSTTDIYNQLIQYNKVKRPYIGIGGLELDDKTAQKYNLVKGIYIKSIESFSSAEKAGLKVGDVIISADGKAVSTMDELNEIKNSHKIGDEMTLKINREGKEQDIKLTLQEQP